MSFWEYKNDKALGQVFLGPRCEPWLGFRVCFHEILEAFGVDAVFGIEKDFNVGGYLGIEIPLGNVFLSILLEVELATLPRMP